MSSNQCAINMDNNEDQNQVQQVARQTQAMAVYDNTVGILSTQFNSNIYVYNLQICIL